MLLPRDKMNFRVWDSCHGGTGRVLATEMLDTHSNAHPGFCYLADIIVEPGATIGEHTHTDDEEIYFILDGEGEMILDGKPQTVRAGDLIQTKKGHSHSLRANTDRPMRIFVAITNV